jgi:hypothetical protein
MGTYKLSESDLRLIRHSSGPNRRSHGDFGLDRLLRGLRRGAAGAAFPRTGTERFRDNRPDGPGTSAAFGTASEAPVNLLRAARRIFCCGDGSANVVVGQYVTGTYDHENETRRDNDCGWILLGHPVKRKEKTACFEQFELPESQANSWGRRIH